MSMTTWTSRFWPASGAPCRRSDLSRVSWSVALATGPTSQSSTWSRQRHLRNVRITILVSWCVKQKVSAIKAHWHTEQTNWKTLQMQKIKINSTKASSMQSLRWSNTLCQWKRRRRKMRTASSWALRSLIARTLRCQTIWSNQSLTRKLSAHPTRLWSNRVVRQPSRWVLRQMLRTP